jgi:hypothetical protein
MAANRVAIIRCCYIPSVSKKMRVTARTTGFCCWIRTPKAVGRGRCRAARWNRARPSRRPWSARCGRRTGSRSGRRSAVRVRCRADERRTPHLRMPTGRWHLRGARTRCGYAADPGGGVRAIRRPAVAGIQRAVRCPGPGGLAGRGVVHGPQEQHQAVGPAPPQADDRGATNCPPQTPAVERRRPSRRRDRRGTSFGRWCIDAGATADTVTAMPLEQIRTISAYGYRLGGPSAWNLHPFKVGVALRTESYAETDPTQQFAQCATVAVRAKLGFPAERPVSGSCRSCSRRRWMSRNRPSVTSCTVDASIVTATSTWGRRRRNRCVVGAASGVVVLRERPDHLVGEHDLEGAVGDRVHREGERPGRPRRGRRPVGLVCHSSGRCGGSCVTRRTRRAGKPCAACISTASKPARAATAAAEAYAESRVSKSACDCVSVLARFPVRCPVRSDRLHGAVERHCG